MDETFVMPVLAYNQKDNQAYGTCYQHGSHMKLELDTFQDYEEIQNAIADDSLHIPKECLVAGVASLNENKPLQPFLMWPTCSKKEEAGIEALIIEVNEQMMEKHGFPLMNVCTDGDPARRKIMNNLMKVEVDDDYPWFQHGSTTLLVLVE